MHEKPFPHDYVMAATVLRIIPLWMTPNMFTIARFALTPLVIFFMVIGNYQIAIPLFVFTAFTDMIDGSLARIRKQVTPWGTIFDPVADKLLIGSCVIILVVRYLSPWVAATIIGLEILTMCGGLMKKRVGIIVSPSWWGKSKMIAQVVAVTVMLFGVFYQSIFLLTSAHYIFVIAIALSVINVIKYGVHF